MATNILHWLHNYVYFVMSCFSLVPRPLPPQGEAWYTLFGLHINIPSFQGIRKIAYTYRTLVTYTNRVPWGEGPGDEANYAYEGHTVTDQNAKWVSIALTTCTSPMLYSYYILSTILLHLIRRPQTLVMTFDPTFMGYPGILDKWKRSLWATSGANCRSIVLTQSYCWLSTKE